jgi:hypothetical protein
MRRDLNNIFLYEREENEMALIANTVGLAVRDTGDVELLEGGVESASQGSDEIVITIRNGTVVKFVQSVYYSSLEGINGDGI